MNVRIFWVRAMKCMCAQTRPRFILLSERVLGGMEFEPMLTPREKIPCTENVPRGGSNPRRCGQRAQTLPTSYSGPQVTGMTSPSKKIHSESENWTQVCWSWGWGLATGPGRQSFEGKVLKACQMSSSLQSVLRRMVISVVWHRCAPRQSLSHQFVGTSLR